MSWMLPDDVVNKAKDAIQQVASEYIGELNDTRTQERLKQAIVAIVAQYGGKVPKDFDVHVHKWEPFEWSLEELSQPEDLRAALDGLAPFRCPCCGTKKFFKAKDLIGVLGKLDIELKIKPAFVATMLSITEEGAELEIVETIETGEEPKIEGGNQP
jgi:hypothetical protein